MTLLERFIEKRWPDAVKHVRIAADGTAKIMVVFYVELDPQGAAESEQEYLMRCDRGVRVGAHRAVR